MSKQNAYLKATRAKSELNAMLIVSLTTLDEVHRALKKVHHAAKELADAIIELAEE
jgi:hypothetical protein